MRVSNIYLAAVATELPGRHSVADAATAGLVDRTIADRTAVTSVATADGRSPADLAAAAATTALRRGGTPADAVRIVLHADVWYQGHDLWAPASYVQRVALDNRCPAVEIRQLSNGGMAALELAAHVLRGADPGGAALITTGDVFGEPGFDRWLSDPGTVYGDGGTAAVLSTVDGFAELRSVVTVSDPRLEGMHRGDDPSGSEPFSVRKPVDMRKQQKDFLAARSTAAVAATVAAGQQETTERALKDAGLTLPEIDWFVLPHFGHRRLSAAYLRPWGINESRTTWSLARTVGHLGAGDQFAGLEHLALSGRLHAGQHVLLAGVGAGFSWSAAVLRVTDTPCATGPAELK